MHKINQSVCKL